VGKRLPGRLGGAEIARTEWYREGRVPLSHSRADMPIYAQCRSDELPMAISGSKDLESSKADQMEHDAGSA